MSIEETLNFEFKLTVTFFESLASHESEPQRRLLDKFPASKHFRTGRPNGGKPGLHAIIDPPLFRVVRQLFVHIEASHWGVHAESIQGASLASWRREFELHQRAVEIDLPDSSRSGKIHPSYLF
ncbi:hypothetical protein SERLA73DRAFT_72780 [Serpula lacrymans var. lacrymans S7.3]|uniref:Uncharacterized protein n=2 Tax=Serpula lacrymans var. lacrymans TaxID=341189 RepID=F8PUJ2_SERL3|nr:uncharacterized protein SERLADRAFT_437330 [Serpula lacrymans var. lacrymans S7.9]EGO00027.1 hypothetical protein SERLA73DRAFT_72780 [Serpula lacrymans var. lacrymans S7.3]EGO25600.1 hypothetical protein SERLADRAFT_437330 [Serpula lacrymans var. lacrymans S7.9]